MRLNWNTCWFDCNFSLRIIVKKSSVHQDNKIKQQFFFKMMGFDYIAIVMLIILSIILNATVVFVLAYNFKKLKSRELILLSLSIADLIKATVGYPYLLTDYERSSNTAATPQCIISAFIITTASITTIAHLVTLSVTIYISLRFPYLMIRLEKKVLCLVVFVLPCWVFGLIWDCYRC